MYELTIIGGGPAGCGAAVYAARKRLKSVLITESFGGQSAGSSEKIENWIGTVSLSGEEFENRLREHVNAYADDALDIKQGVKVTSVSQNSEGKWECITSEGEELLSETLLYAAGAYRKKLSVPGAEEFENKGITYCASCDAPMFAGQDVAVIGGGNAGFETAAQLLNLANSVTLLHHKKEFKAEPITVEKVSSHPRMTVITNAETQKITGDQFVNGLVYKDLETEQTHQLAVNGVFVEIGLKPNTAPLSEEPKLLDEYGRIKVDPRTQRTAADGLWAAGDCTDGLFHQNNIACGDAIKALEDIYMYLKTS